MDESLSIQRALHRRQKARIAAALEAASPAFRAYEARYRRRTRTYQSVLSPKDVVREVLAADVVYVGDYHTLRIAQDAYRALAEAAFASGRRVVLALEMVEGRHQDALDAYLHRRLSDRALLSRLGHPEAGFSLWPGFRPIFELARAHKAQAVAIDRRATGPRSLLIRDRYAADRIAAAAAAPDRPLVLVLVGQYHVAPCHLPAQVRRALGGTGRKHLVVYQNCEGVFWKLARSGQAGAAAVRIREGELCLMNAPPTLCQQSFLDHVEAQPGDAALPPAEGPRAFRQLARLLGRQLRVEVRDQLEGTVVCTVADGDVLERLHQRVTLDDAERARFRRRVLARESCYLPRGQFAYLASLSLNHAAEEAAHFVRHCAVGQAMERPRSRVAEFYARCVEEALGFLGSRLVNPARRCPTLADHARAFRQGRRKERAIAAHVLAIAAAESDGTSPQELRSLLPVHDDEVMDGASHALGYLLGHALDRAFHQGRLGAARLRALFHDPLPDPEAAYFAYRHLADEARPVDSEISRPLLSAAACR